MNASDFHGIYQELIEENPLAIRAVLKVLHVEFTDTVPTLAVTCDERPRLLVNLGFVGEHCQMDAHVKAVICHEFLHVLLRHTERFTTLTPAEHLALDAVINAIIHRGLGPDYSGMMSRYYAGERGVSMYAEMPLIVALLGRLTPYIRRPFWAFSNVVAPARIEQGRLIADTTGGTSLGCVLAHVAKTKPKAAIVVTDGYIESVASAQVAATADTRLHVILTRDGSATELRRAGLPYTQLSRLPS